MIFECEVCHLPMDRERIHYGGLSCYSCRAFFRRKTQKNDLTSCKLKQECKISYIERKSCPPCRYEKCKSAGMRSSLVLNEKEKHQRFKKHKKEEDNSDEDENDFEVNENVNKSIKRVIPDQEINKKRKRQITSEYTYPGPSKQTSFLHTKSWETFIVSDSESEHELDNHWPEVIENLIEENPEEGCFLDPETGLMVNPSDQYNLGSNGIKEMENGILDQFQSENMSVKNNLCTNSGSSTSRRCSVIIGKSNEIPVKERRKKFIFSDDNQIMKYVHKKFGVAAVKEQSSIIDARIENCIKRSSVLNYTDKNEHQHVHHLEHRVQHPYEYPTEHPNEMCRQETLGLQENLQNFQHWVYNRNSVIVKQILTEENIISARLDEVDDEHEDFENDAQHIEVISSLTVKEIKNLYTMEEDAFFKNMTNSFHENFKSINFGPKIIGNYIDFCKKPKTIPADYLLETNKVTRERLLNCICSIEDMAFLPTSCQFNLLKKNIPVAETLLHIVAFNLKYKKDHQDFWLGEKDWEQWKARPSGIEWELLPTLLSYLPLPDALKRSLNKAMTFCFKPILQDPHVLAVLIMMIIFSQDKSESDPEVSNLMSQYMTMLRRHLTNTMCEDLEEVLAYLANCLVVLPALLEENYDALVEIL